MAYATAAAIAIAVIGAGVTVYGQQQQAKAVKSTAEFNAKIAENEAKQVELERAENARRKRRENKGLLGKQRALIAKSGVALQGSPLDLVAETAGDLETSLFDQNRVAEARKSQLIGKAGITRFEGRQISSAIRIKSVGTALSSATSVANTVQNS